MRRLWCAIPVSLVFGAALSSPSHAAPPKPVKAPRPQRPPSAEEAARADDVPIAANAGSYLALRLSADADTPATVPPQLSAMLQQMVGSDFVDAGAVAAITIDRERSILVSNGIVDPARLQALLALAEPPPEEWPFFVRYLVVVPVRDPIRARAALDRIMPERTCARRRGDEKHWATWLGRLEDPGDRRAAEASDATYLCLSGLSGTVVTINRARRELRWVTASGLGSTLTAASEKLALDRALSDRLQGDGFFSASSAMFITPAGDARVQAALGIIKTRAGLAGIVKEERPRLWKKGAAEMGAPRRLIESPPILLSGMLAADGLVTWTLTEDGRKFFSSLGLRRGTSVKALKTSIAARLKPSGAFSDPKLLDDTQHEAGGMAPTLIRHALWPHAIAFAAAHGGGMPAPFLQTFFDDYDEDSPIEVDAAAGRIRFRPTRSMLKR